MSVQPVRVTPGWLSLREGADAAARAVDLVDLLRPHLSVAVPVVVHDLGCGTGSMARWLAPRLAGPQHWVLHDRDADLLADAELGLPRYAADGSDVTGETRCGDVTRLGDGGLDGATLVTAAALLDLLTAPELARLVTSCVAARCPALLTLSVTGHVELTPGDPLDEALGSAFNDHQRRMTGGRRLLGPDAVGGAVGLFTRLGADVVVRPSSWQLGAADRPLILDWLAGWVGAALELQPALVEPAVAYVERRRAQADAGELRVRVDHVDLLAVPR